MVNMKKTLNDTTEKHVLMVVDNTCEYDSRVIKEAEALCSSGYQVCVLCRVGDYLPGNEIINDVRYSRKINASNISKKELVRSFINKCKVLKNTSVLDFTDFIKQLILVIYGVFKLLISLFFCVVVRVFYMPIQGHYIKQAIKDIIMGFSPDVIHVHDLFPLDAAVKLAEKYKLKVIYDAHELELHKNNMRMIDKLWVKYYEAKNIVKVDAVITVCESIAEHLAKLYKIKMPTVIFNAPIICGIKKESDSIRQVLGLKESIPLVIYVGKTTVNRGLEQLFQAMTLCEEYHLALVGPSDGQVKSMLESLAKQLNITKRVHFYPGVPMDEVVPFISSADVGVVATQNVCLSYEYSLPNKLFEMTFANLPVCVSQLPEHEMFLKDTGNGILVDEKNPQDIANAIREIYENKGKYLISDKSMETIIEKYSWASQVKKLKVQYAEILSATNI